MALLPNPTLRQLQLIKAHNLDNIFKAGNGQQVEGVGIGPKTPNATVPEVRFDADGTNTIVIVTQFSGFTPWFTTLSGTDDDGSEISIEPSYVARGTWIPGAESRVARGQPTESTNLDEEFFREPDANSTSARLLIYDQKERDQLMAGVHIEAQFERTRAAPIKGKESTCLADDGTAKVPGTLGFIGQTWDTDKLVAVTCHHVAVSIGSVFVTKSENNSEVSGTEITGDYVVGKRDGDYILQVCPEGQNTFVDARTKRNWQQKDGTRSDDFKIGHPSPGDCCGLGRDNFGRLYRSTYTAQVDAAAILLADSETDCCIWPLLLPGSDDLTDWRAEMLGKNGSSEVGVSVEIQGPVTTEITLDELQDNTTHILSYRVRKYGSTTGYTTGIVRCIEYTQNPAIATRHDVPELLTDEQIPGKGNHGKDERATVPITQPAFDDFIYVMPCKIPVPVSGVPEVAELFAAGGDSGAGVVNGAGQLVGLVVNGIPNNAEVIDLIKDGWGASVSRISHTLNALKVDVKAFRIDLGRIRTVPVGNEDFATTLARSGLPKPAIDVIQSPLSATARQLLPEVRRLVNRNRKVMVAWHRNSGPLLARQLIQAFRDPDFRVPRDLNGQQSTELMSNFISSLRLECDESGRRALDELEPWLLRAPGATLSELAAVLKEES